MSKRLGLFTVLRVPVVGFYFSQNQSRSSNLFAKIRMMFTGQAPLFLAEQKFISWRQIFFLSSAFLLQAMRRWKSFLLTMTWIPLCEWIA